MEGKVHEWREGELPVKSRRVTIKYIFFEKNVLTRGKSRLWQLLSI